MPEIDLEEITLNDLILIVGGFIHRGGDIKNLDIELLLRLQELIEIQLNKQTLSVPKGEKIH